ncbi:MAG: ATP-binding cassette domain-containing protein, partial [Rectinema sp.]|nr:ATP-binding cassette domain-containing protein [Rectinema sp.]
MAYIVEMLHITKDFPGIRANDDITLQIEERSIHALLGENGAGKSTLMSILFGLYQPDGGTIRVRGKEVRISDPNVATSLGIGMVHQHFKLVHNFTVTENIILGMEPRKGMTIDIRSAERKVEEISKLYGLAVDPRAKIEDISVGMQQRVEILKMLYRDAEILIFDEPTAVLTPQEIHELMHIMRRLVQEGKTILLITHKLKEIKEVADICTVLR